MDIAYLADHPQFVSTLAAWFLDEWGFFVPGGTLETFAVRVRDHMNRDTLPVALVAIEGSELLGSASLRAHDMDTRPARTPWLGGVYVAPRFRNRGVGSRLVRAVEAKARELGWGVLFLFTFDREAFYARRGWALLEKTEYRGHLVTVMTKALA